MKRNIVIAFAIAAMMAAMPLIAQQGGGQGNGNGPRRERGEGRPGQMRPFQVSPSQALRFLDVNMIERSAQNLELTEAQLNQIKELINNDAEGTKALQTKADASAKAFTDALYADNYDADAVAKLLATAQADEAAVTAAKLKTWTNVRAVLTAEQRAKLAKGGAFMMGGPGMGGPGMGRPGQGRPGQGWGRPDGQRGQGRGQGRGWGERPQQPAEPEEDFEE